MYLIAYWYTVFMYSCAYTECVNDYEYQGMYSQYIFKAKSSSLTCRFGRNSKK